LGPISRQQRLREPSRNSQAQTPAKMTKIIKQYESVRQASREGKVNLIEIKEESPQKGVIQLIALTARSSCEN
jgi:indole-3-glycerol phosphate synthase